MLTLRTAIGLTQAGLAEFLGVSRKAVGGWESGGSYPKAGHLKALLTLAVQQGTFPAGREAEEIRAFWKAAHQKVLLDESWLSALLSQHPRPLERMVPPSIEVTGDATPALAAPASGPRVEWSEALDVPTFYGREPELATLSQWVVQERCRVVCVLGMGGIGKSALVVRAMQQLAEHFAVVLFRSLRDAPDCSALLDDCLSVLSPEPLGMVPQSLERRLSLLLEDLRSRRVLLVLDNLEVLLEAGEVRGHLRPGFEAYGHLLRQVAQTGHQSCLLLTSREKPAALRSLEGSRTPVRSLRLLGLEATACEQLLAEHELVGSPQERARLVERYEGNPLALNIVAETITDLFGGAIGQFLAQDRLVFGSITALLDEQFGRLSALEQPILYRLAIAREPLTLQELQAGPPAPLAAVQLLEAVDGLRRRSLIERGQRVGSFTLQSVVLEYVTAHLVEQLVGEVVQDRLSLLIQHPLSQAQAKDYVRQTQERLLVAPLLDRLQSVYQGHIEVEQRLRSLLEEVRNWAQDRQGYAPANLVTLLRLLRGHLRGLDLSRLVLRGVSLQGVEIQDTSLSGALLQESVFTETFDAITAVATSPDGQYWAAASKRGEVRVWESGQEVGPTLHLAWRAHTDTSYALAFSPDSRLLASGSWDGTLKLWDVENGALRWSIWHPGAICLAFDPDGGRLASGELDGSVRLWDAKLGSPLEDVPHPGPVYALAWSPDGYLLVSGDVAGTLRLWEIGHSGPVTCVQTLSGHSSWVRGLAFAPDGSSVASASWDGSVKLWEVEEEGSLRVRQTLVGHTEKVQCVAWSPNGGTLASGSYDHTIRLWQAQQGSARMALPGHSAAVTGLAFTPDSRRLLSGSDDGTLRLWDVDSGELLRTLQGYAASLFDLDWSPDGTRLASADSDSVVSIWEVERSTPLKVLYGHRGGVYAVAWSPDGRLLASSALDSAVRVWDARTGESRQILRDPDHVDTLFFGVAWSPDGRLLASGASLPRVHVWEMTTGSRNWAAQQLSTWIRHLAWSPDGTQLVGGGDDGQVYVWEATEGTRLQRLAGHQGVVRSVVWSPDGKRLASAGRSRGSGERVELDAQSWEPGRRVAEQERVICAAVWSPDGSRLVSGSSDGRLCWWEVHSGECIRVRQAHTGTIRSLRSGPDGRRLASCGDDTCITLWDLESGQHPRNLRRHPPNERHRITGIRGLTEAQKAMLRALGAVEDKAVNSS